MGYFITIEGGEGSGKTSVLQEVIKLLNNDGYTNIVTSREPGGIKIATQIREVLFDKEKDKYIPAIVMTDNFERAFSVFEQYFPATSIGEDTKSIKKDVSKNSSGVNLKNPTASVLADCEELHNLFLMHVNDEYRGYGNEVHTIGEQVSNFRECIDDFTFETPLL